MAHLASEIKHETRSAFKRPLSVLVVVHTLQAQVLLLQRTKTPQYWQSVTGSFEWHESDAHEVAKRELAEECGWEIEGNRLKACPIVNQFKLFPQWQKRYGENVHFNREWVFSYALDQPIAPILAAHEHTAWQWCSFHEALNRCFFWSNKDAIAWLSVHYGWQ